MMDVTTVKVPLCEAGAMKMEIVGAITRRLQGDTRPPSDLFGIALAAMSEAMADMLFAAAQDKAHGDHLLRLLIARVEQRWQELAERH